MHVDGAVGGIGVGLTYYGCEDSTEKCFYMHYYGGGTIIVEI